LAAFKVAVEDARTSLASPLVTSVSKRSLVTEDSMALSNAERQRRYIARLKERAAVTNESVTNESVTNESVTNELVRLKAFADQLEHKNEALKKKLETVTNEVEKLKASIDELRRENKTLREPKARRYSRFAPNGAAMTATQFAAILKCLHPDTVHRLSDDDVTKQFNEAFKIFNGLRSQLVK
jgi:dynactin complex subunit